MLPSRHVLPLCLLPGLVACGGSVEGADRDAGAARLVFEAASRTGIESKPTVVVEWRANELRTLAPRRGRGTELEEGRLRLDATVTRLTLPELPPRAFDRVVLETRSSGGTFDLHLLDAYGQEILSVPSPTPLPRKPTKDEFAVVEWPEARALAGRARSMVLRLESCPRPPQIVSIRLTSSEPETWLPEPGQPRIVDLGPDGRRAVGLSNRRPLAIRLAPGQAAGNLTFACGVPPYLHGEEQSPPELVLTVSDRAHAQVWSERFEVPVGRWLEHHYRLPAEVAGRTVGLDFELEGSGPAATVCALTVPIVERPLARPRSVMLITSDTHRADHLGLARDGVGVRTPFIDRLANRGYLFDDCQAEGNTTNPTHVSIMTGVPVRDHGVIGNDAAVGDAASTLAEAYRDAGFHTFAALGAAHLAWSGCGQGFDRLTAPAVGQRDSRETIDVLEGWLEEAKHRSLFVWLHLFDAHAPYDPPVPYRDMYWTARGDAPPGGEIPTWADVQDVRQLAARYQGEVSYLDNRLHSLFRAWPRLAAGVVALVGDHGENMSHPEPEWSFTHHGLSADTLQVPLLLAWPGAPGATRVARPVCQRDLGRTLLDLSGLDGVEFPGQNLVTLAEQAPAQVGEVARFAIAGNALQASLRRGPWLLVQGLYGAGREGHQRLTDHRVQLFDVEQDPGCRQDLVEEHHQRACAMRADLVTWLTAARSGRWGADEPRQDPTTRKHLAALGYSASSALPGGNPWIDPACECEHCQRFPLKVQ